MAASKQGQNNLSVVSDCRVSSLHFFRLLILAVTSPEFPLCSCFARLGPRRACDAASASDDKSFSFSISEQSSRTTVHSLDGNFIGTRRIPRYACVHFSVTFVAGASTAMAWSIPNWVTAKTVSEEGKLFRKRLCGSQEAAMNERRMRVSRENCSEVGRHSFETAPHTQM